MGKHADQGWPVTETKLARLPEKGLRLPKGPEAIHSLFFHFPRSKVNPRRREGACPGTCQYVFFRKTTRDDPRSHGIRASPRARLQKGFSPSWDQDSLPVLGVSKECGSRCGFWTDMSTIGIEERQGEEGVCASPAACDCGEGMTGMGHVESASP